jgi:hypothetical protein
MEVYRAINAVQADLSSVGITKDRKNQQQGYNFRGIDDVYNVLSPLLAKHNLVILPRVISRECVERQGKSGGALFYVTVHAEFDFVAAKDGSKHTVITFGEAMDSADKATNKAMSAAYKYAAFQAFAIPTEGDNDADAQTPEVKPKTAPKSQPSQAQEVNGTAATDAQCKAIYSMLSKRGKTDKEDILKDLSAFFRRPIMSSKELTKGEASEYIEALQKEAA